MQGSRPDRVGEQIRQEISLMLLRDVHDPGIGLVTLTRVKVSPDLQLARVYYTEIGDEKAKLETRKALERALPFLRRQLGTRMRLRRVPELRFEFDKSVENQDRIEKILLDLEAERRARGDDGAGEPGSDLQSGSASDSEPESEPEPESGGKDTE